MKALQVRIFKMIIPLYQSIKKCVRSLTFEVHQISLYVSYIYRISRKRKKSNSTHYVRITSKFSVFKWPIKPKTADQAGHKIDGTYQNVGDDFDYKHITQNASLSFAKVGAI